MLADGGEGRLDVASAALPEEHESDGAFLRHWAAYRVSPGERLTRSELADRLARRGYAIIDRTPAKSVAS